ncbi:hypothetical protein FRC04_003143 [Tulasnella sp. 424]|nr:hypothetical protein FRC04_003143 [Tulasnella sp. 424]
MNSESNVGRPPTIPSAISPPRRRQTTQSEVSNTNFYKRVQDARSVAVSVLEGTEWPRRSRAAAQDLLQAIKRSPNIQELPGDASDIPEDLRAAVEKFISVLREVNTKLDKIASKYGTRQRGMRERIKYFLSMLREGRCGQILQICHVEIDLASKAIHENFGDGVNEAMGNSLGAHLARSTELTVEGLIAGDHSKSEKGSPELPVSSGDEKLIVSSGEVHSTGGFGIPKNEQVHSTAALGGGGRTSGGPENHLLGTGSNF